MRPRLIAATAAVLLLALTGCSGSVEPESGVAAQSAPADETTDSKPAPLVAETPSGDALDEAYLEFVRGDLMPDSGVRNASDDELIAAGHEACKQMAEGVPHDDLRLVEGEQPQPTGLYADSGSILTGALGTYCPELVTPTE